MRRDQGGDGGGVGEAFRTNVVRKCQTEMACWVGSRYTEITLACLNVGDEDHGGVTEDLNQFYWDVVFGLFECLPASS